MFEYTASNYKDGDFWNSITRENNYLEQYFKSGFQCLFYEYIISDESYEEEGSKVELDFI